MFSKFHQKFQLREVFALRPRPCVGEVRFLDDHDDEMRFPIDWQICTVII